MKRTLAVGLALFLALLAACGSTAGTAGADTGSTALESTPLADPGTAVEQSDALNHPADEAEADDRILLFEEELPQNSPQHEEYLEQYVYPYTIVGLFGANFGPGDHTELYDYLKSMFNAFALARPDNDLTLTDDETTLEQDVFEGILMSHLDLSPEEIRTACAEYYDQESETYTASYGFGGYGGEYYITASSLEDGILTLAYDCYSLDFDYNMSGQSDTPRYVLVRQGEVVIAVDGDDYKYISNQVQDAPGIEQ